jgi:hypothetical protein
MRPFPEWHLHLACVRHVRLRKTTSVATIVTTYARLAPQKLQLFLETYERILRIIAHVIEEFTLYTVNVDQTLYD